MGTMKGLGTGGAFSGYCLTKNFGIIGASVVSSFRVDSLTIRVKGLWVGTLSS